MQRLLELGTEIRHRRIAYNLSMDDVAKKAGITRATLTEIEKGNEKCSIGSYFRVMDILDIDVSFIKTYSIPKRKRVTRRNTAYQKKINQFVIICVEMYAKHINKPSNEVYFLLLTSGLLNILRDDYEDMHGFGFEYINDYTDKYLKARNLL